MRKIFIFIFLYGMLFASLSAIEAECEPLTVIADGTGSTKNEALQNAWTAAVHKAVGLFLTSKEEMINEELTEKIITHSRGQVNAFKVLSEKQENGIWNIEIEANIEKDVLKETTARSGSQKMVLDAANIAARRHTVSEKHDSAKEIIMDTLSGLDLNKIIRYEAKLKQEEIKGNTVFYVQHIFSVDFEQFKVMADQLARSLAPVSLSKETVIIEPQWGKTVMKSLKNNTIPKAEKFNQYTLLFSLQDPKLAANESFPKNSICFFKNASKAECYTFNEEIMSEIKSKLWEKNRYKLTFEAEGGETVSEVSQFREIDWPFYFKDNAIFIAPIFFIYGPYGRHFASQLFYDQLLELSNEDMLNVKEIVGTYTLKHIFKKFYLHDL